MLKRSTFLAAVSLMLALGLSAQAGFLSFDCDFPDDPCQVNHDWTFTPDDNGSVIKGYLELSESIPALGYDSVAMSGETNEDPVFHITKTVTNVTGVAWDAYELTLPAQPADVSFVNGSGLSDKFNNASYPDVWTLLFTAPDLVLDGQDVTLEFDIEVASTGLFGFTLTQNPIPEPITLSFLGLGTLVLLRRRKA